MNLLLLSSDKIQLYKLSKGWTVSGVKLLPLNFKSILLTCFVVLGLGFCKSHFSLVGPLTTEPGKVDERRDLLFPLPASLLVLSLSFCKSPPQI
jgi:hypothetical protein